MSDDVSRNPLREVATKVGGVVTILISLVGTVVQFGYLSSAQAEALTTAGSALPDVILYVGGGITLVTGLVGGVLAAFRTAVAGEKVVTPLVDPRDQAGNALLALGRHSSGE